MFVCAMSVAHDGFTASKAEEEETFYKLLKNAMGNASAHGLPNIDRSESIPRKLFWTALFLTGLGMFLWQCSLIIEAFYARSVDTSIELRYSKNLSFPAITICNLNSIKLSKLRYNQMLNELLGSVTTQSVKDTQEATTSPQFQATKSSSVMSSESSNSNDSDNELPSVLQGNTAGIAQSQTVKPPITEHSHSNNGNNQGNNEFAQPDADQTNLQPATTAIDKAAGGACGGGGDGDGDGLSQPQVTTKPPAIATENSVMNSGSNEVSSPSESEAPFGSLDGSTTYKSQTTLNIGDNVGNNFPGGNPGGKGPPHHLTESFVAATSTSISDISDAVSTTTTETEHLLSLKTVMPSHVSTEAISTAQPTSTSEGNSGGKGPPQDLTQSSAVTTSASISSLSATVSSSTTTTEHLSSLKSVTPSHVSTKSVSTAQLTSTQGGNPGGKGPPQDLTQSSAVTGASISDSSATVSSSTIATEHLSSLKTVTPSHVSTESVSMAQLTSTSGGNLGGNPDGKGPPQDLTQSSAVPTSASISSLSGAISTAKTATEHLSSLQTLTSSQSATESVSTSHLTSTSQFSTELTSHVKETLSTSTISSLTSPASTVLPSKLTTAQESVSASTQQLSTSTSIVALKEISTTSPTSSSTYTVSTVSTSQLTTPQESVSVSTQQLSTESTSFVKENLSTSPMPSSAPPVSTISEKKLTNAHESVPASTISPEIMSTSRTLTSTPQLNTVSTSSVKENLSTSLISSSSSPMSTESTSQLRTAQQSVSASTQQSSTDSTSIVTLKETSSTSSTSSSTSPVSTVSTSPTTAQKTVSASTQPLSTESTSINQQTTQSTENNLTTQPKSGPGSGVSGIPGGSGSGGKPSGPGSGGGPQQKRRRRDGRIPTTVAQVKLLGVLYHYTCSYRTFKKKTTHLSIC